MKTVINTERLMSIRKENGLTQEEAANRIGITQPAYQRYEAGTRTPSYPVIKEMARAFKTSVDYLTGKSVPPVPDYITVNSTESPLLYTVIEKCQNCNDEQLKRLLKYFEKLNNTKGSDPNVSQ